MAACWLLFSTAGRLTLVVQYTKEKRIETQKEDVLELVALLTICAS